MKLNARHTALIVVDMQTALFDPPPAEAEEVIARINGLAGRARAADAPVVFIQHETVSGALAWSSPGWRLHAELLQAPADLRVRKKMSDAFLHTALHAELAARDVRHLLVCGYSSEFCVDSTVRGGAARGYAITLVADAHTSHDKPHANGLQIRTHENETLRNISSFPGAIDAVPAAEIGFA